MSYFSADKESYEGVRSFKTVPGPHHVDLIHLDVQNCQTDTAFMLVDLSDTTNWPHTDTHHLHLDTVDIHFNPGDSFTGDIQLGFLSDVDASNGDLHVAHVWHFERDRVTMMDQLSWEAIQVSMQAAHWFGPIVADNLLFRTGENLQGPDGNTSYPSGDGDLVLRVNRTAGAIDLGITAAYNTL